MTAKRAMTGNLVPSLSSQFVVVCPVSNAGIVKNFYIRVREVNKEGDLKVLTVDHGE
jgi:hypothetical protein